VSERIRFHLDEHISPKVARALRWKGIDVTTTVEAGLRTAPDEDHIQLARREGRGIVTDDSDLIAFAGSPTHHPGIVIVHRHQRSLRQIIRGLLLIYEVLEPEDMAGQTEFL
jgi:predicted nuclease of predicted toxin-antitoxin system